MFGLREPVISTLLFQAAVAAVVPGVAAVTVSPSLGAVMPFVAAGSMAAALYTMRGALTKPRSTSPSKRENNSEIERSARHAAFTFVFGLLVGGALTGAVVEQLDWHPNSSAFFLGVAGEKIIAFISDRDLFEAVKKWILKRFGSE